MDSTTAPARTHMTAGEVVEWAERLYKCSDSLTELGGQIKSTDAVISGNLLRLRDEIERTFDNVERLVGRLTLQELRDS